MAKLERITTHISKRQYRLIAASARDKGVSFAEVLRSLLDKALVQDSKN